MVIVSLRIGKSNFFLQKQTSVARVIDSVVSWEEQLALYVSVSP